VNWINTEIRSKIAPLVTIIYLFIGCSNPGQYPMISAFYLQRGIVKILGWKIANKNRIPMDPFLAFEESLWVVIFIELDDGKIYRKALYLMVKTMVSCRFSLKPIQ